MTVGRAGDVVCCGHYFRRIGQRWACVNLGCDEIRLPDGTTADVLVPELVVPATLEGLARG